MKSSVFGRRLANGLVCRSSAESRRIHVAPDNCVNLVNSSSPSICPRQPTSSESGRSLSLSLFPSFSLSARKIQQTVESRPAGGPSAQTEHCAWSRRDSRERATAGTWKQKEGKSEDAHEYARGTPPLAPAYISSPWHTMAPIVYLKIAAFMKAHRRGCCSLDLHVHTHTCIYNIYIYICATSCFRHQLPSLFPRVVIVISRDGEDSRKR